MLKLLALALSLAVTDTVTAQIPLCTGRDAFDPQKSPCRVRECRATNEETWKKSKKCLRAPTCEEIRQSRKKYRRYSDMCQENKATECFQTRLGFPFALTTSRKKNNSDSETCEGLTRWYGFCVTKESKNGRKVQIGMIRKTIMKNGDQELFAVASNRAGCSGFVNTDSISVNPYSSKCGETYAAKWLLPSFAAATMGKLTKETITTADGRVRKYWLFRSNANLSSTGGDKAPLVIDIHGYTGCAEYNAFSVGWLPIAAKQNMVIAWPQSLEFASTDVFTGIYSPFVSSWTVGDLPTDAYFAEVDDMAFLKNMIGGIQGQTALNIDPSRLYMTGHSLGSGLAQQFAFDESAITAAVVQFAFFLASFPQTQKEISELVKKGILELSINSNMGVKLASPVPIFNVHATGDETVLYEVVTCTPEELLLGCKPSFGARPNNNLWAAINECTKSSIKEFSTPSPYNITTFSECGGDEVNAVEVKLLTIDGGSHYPFKGYEQQQIETTQQAWEFIKNFSKPGASSSHV